MDVVCMCIVSCVWRSQVTCKRSDVSIYHVCHSDGTHVIKPNNKYLYRLSHLNPPISLILSYDQINFDLGTIDVNKWW